MIDLSGLDTEQIAIMHEAGRALLWSEQHFARGRTNVVAEMLKGAGPFHEMCHYPPGDVYDPESHAQYYYHSHRRDPPAGAEHGHFHTFLRPGGMPAGVRPASVPGQAEARDPDDAVSHLIGVSMDTAGRPIGLFTTNRWVTDETWYSAEDVIRMVDRFAVDHPMPSWPANRWLTALVRVFRPQIAELLRARDRRISELRDRDPDRAVLEDRTLEILSEASIDLPRQIAAIKAALARARTASRQSTAVAVRK